MDVAVEHKILGHSRPKQFDVNIRENVRIPSSEPGITLGADLYLPATNAPAPALVTVYSSPKDGFGGMRHRRYLQYFAERGYAAIYVDCRGVGTSDGATRPMLSNTEIDDAEHVVEWVADQPWCTGSVGMWGLSHGAMITLAVASRRPLGLNAICPIMGLTDIERELVHPAGVRGGLIMFGHLGLYDLLGALQLPLRSHGITEREESWQERARNFDPWFLDAWRNNPGAAEWSTRKVDVSKIHAPTFCIAGWRDIFCNAMVRAYEEIEAPKKLLVGPWLHTFPEASSVEKVNAMAPMCDWWDKWLIDPGSTTSFDHAVTIYLQGHNSRWVQSASWPPGHVQELTFVTTLNGQLSCKEGQLPEKSSHSTIANDSATVRQPLDPTVGVLSGLSLHSAINFGYPIDQHEDDGRSLAFTSQPLDQQTVISGRPMVTLVIDPATTASRCVAKLTEVDPAGRSKMISTGLVNLLADLRNKTQISEVSMELDPTCYTIAPGNRIRVVLSDSDFPRLWPDRKQGELIVVVGKIDDSKSGTGNSSYMTRLRLPIADTAHLVDVGFLPPERRQRNRTDKKRPDEKWEVTRDYYAGSIEITLDASMSGAHIPGRSNMWERRMTMSAVTYESDSSKSKILATGIDTAETEDGDKVQVRAVIEMTQEGARVHAVVSKNEHELITRDWQIEKPRT